MNTQEHPILAVSVMIESMHHCEVCHRNCADGELIEVNAIAYLRWERASPWYICNDCAKKISDALKEKEGKNE